MVALDGVLFWQKQKLHLMATMLISCAKSINSTWWSQGRFCVFEAKIPPSGHHMDFMCQSSKFHLMATTQILCAKGQNFAKWPSCGFFCYKSKTLISITQVLWFMCMCQGLGFRIPHLSAIAILGTNGKYDIVRSYLCGVKQNLLQFVSC